MFAKFIIVAALASGLAVSAQATVISPTGGALPAGISTIGGLVFDGIGLNGSRLVRQVPAGDLFSGFTNTSILIGSQTGFNSSTLGQLGGGFASVSIRITLFDGDNAPGNFDFNKNLLRINGINISNFSTVATTQTDDLGNVLGTGTGFGDNRLDTGFFPITDGGTLGSLFASLAASGRADFSLFKFDTVQQEYDFTRGLNAPLIGGGGGNSGGAPVPVEPPQPDDPPTAGEPPQPDNPPVVVDPPQPDGPPLAVVPLPAAGLFLMTGLAAAVLLRRRTRRPAA